MATTTTNYGLKKPAATDFYDIDDFNNNADLLDDVLENKVDKAVGKALSTNDYDNTAKSIVDNTVGIKGIGTDAEIHNDIVSNVAGIVGYKVISGFKYNSNTIVLDSVAGLSLGDKLCYITAAYLYETDFTGNKLGAITNINASTNSVTFENVVDNIAGGPPVMYDTVVFVKGKPNLGTATGKEWLKLQLSAYSDYETASGSGNISVGKCAEAHGLSSVAANKCTEVHGEGLYASGKHQFVVGRFNTKPSGSQENGSDYNNAASVVFAIGNGTSDTTRKNIMRVNALGGVYAQAAYNSTGADYAEMFEWEDDNPNNEDRRGLFVTLDGDKIRLTTASDDYILGIVSANPGVVGNNYGDQWQGMYETDLWGNIVIGDDGNPVINVNYDPDQVYIPRENRKEWGCVGLMGQLISIDDGTCTVNGCCKVGANGVATASESGYRVMKRIDDTHVLVLFR